MLYEIEQAVFERFPGYARMAVVAEGVDNTREIPELAELLAIEDFLLACRSGILTVLALTVAPQATAAHKDEQEEDDDPPRAALSPAFVIVATGHGSDIAQRHVIHS